MMYQDYTFHTHSHTHKREQKRSFTKPVPYTKLSSVADLPN
jgi:hypothetical protein